MLQLQGLTKMFQVVQVQTHALRGVDLHVGEGGALRSRSVRLGGFDVSQHCRHFKGVDCRVLST